MGQRRGVWWHNASGLVIGAALLTATPALAPDAFATKLHRLHVVHAVYRMHVTHVAANRRHSSKFTWKGAKAHYAYGSPRLQCVTFARAASGIDLKGNAADWWDEAAGIYQRGNRPEPGSVLNFRPNGHMRLGHVAVVTAVTSSREIEIAHAHWAGPGSNNGGVARNISVVDVSPGNDWSSVRVGLGQPGEYGWVYGAYGFIYDRADRGVAVANQSAGTLSPTVLTLDELAQAVPRRHPKARLIDPNLITDAPPRSLR